MEINSASHQKKNDKPNRRFDLLFLTLVLLLSSGCVFCSTSVSINIWPDQLSSTLLAKSRAAYSRDSNNVRFAVLDPLVAIEAATDTARLLITPSGDENGRNTTIAVLPPTPTATRNRARSETPIAQSPTANTATPFPVASPTIDLLPTPTTLPTATSQPTLPPDTPTLIAPTSTLPSFSSPTVTSPAIPTNTPPSTPTPLSQQLPTAPASTSEPPSPPTSPPPTPTPLPSLPTPTFTPVAPTATPIILEISGQVFEDATYAGGTGTAFDPGDFLLPQVRVELYSGSTLITATTTDAAGAYRFSNVNNGAYTVRVVSTTLGDSDTPPQAGFNFSFSNAGAEQTYEHNGLMGNGDVGALGGNDPTIDDSNTALGAGVGDTNTIVTVNNASVAGVDFGFTYNLVINTNDSGQGSLRQAVSNSNALSGIDEVIFNIPAPIPLIIQPLSPLPPITDPIVLDGRTQPGYSDTPVIELDGSNAGSSDGLLISAGQSVIRSLAINRFSDHGLVLDTGGQNLILGNFLGADLAGVINSGNGNDGIRITNGAAQNIIGGLGVQENNVIAFNGGAGINLLSGSENTIRGNTIYSNTNLGLDLNDDGVTANDPGDSDLGPNLGLNFPLIYSAIISGSTLTISGETQPTTTVDIYLARPDPSGYGEGYSLIETTVAISSTPGLVDPTARQFSLSLPLGSFVVGDQITAIATDAAGNTSEFAENVMMTPPPLLITGRVFEDTGYNGGNGSPFGAGDAPLANVLVELYNSSNTFLLSDVTNITGVYTFNLSTLSLGPDTYTVRVVSASIGDSDTPPADGYTGASVTVVAEQTYEHDGASGNGGNGALGGNNRAASDFGTPSGGGIGDTNVAVTVGDADVTGVDFGFVYNLVTNTANNGQGAFRQVLENANAINGRDQVVFNMSGASPYTIRPNSLPALTDSIFINGNSQPGASPFTPLIELDGTNSGGLIIQGGNSIVQGLIINRTGGPGIELQIRGGNIIQDNFIGTDASGTVGLRGMNPGIRIVGARRNIIGGRRNLISGVNNIGILVDYLPQTTRVTAGQQVLYTFEEGGGVTVKDVSGVSPAHDLTIRDPGNVSWELNALNVSSTTQMTATTGAKLYNACTASNEITVEAVIKPENSAQVDPARIVTYSQDASNRNFTLDQTNDQYVVRLRTTTNGLNGDNIVLRSPSGSINTTIPTHLVFTRDNAGTAKLYLNRFQVATTIIDGDFSNWDPDFKLGLANEITTNAGWLGDYGLVSVYCQALSNLDIRQNYNAVAENYIRHNYIGSSRSGWSPIGNNFGIYISNSSNTVIGGYQSSFRNVISSNADSAIFITGSQAAGNKILGNYIGVNQSGSNPLSNGRGIYLTNDAHDNFIGADFPGAGNVIAYSNAANGIGIGLLEMTP